jgi:hypothetical protein
MNFVGFISIDEDDNEPELVGNINRLEDLCDLYKVSEVIFCAKDVSSSETMKWMKLIGIRDIQFKIVPDERYFIIGSNSKDLNGELYTEEIHFALSDAYNLRKKYLLDVLICLILLPSGLIWGWFGKGIQTYYQRLFQVMFGTHSWVGYDQSISNVHLPVLKPGVFSVSDENTHVLLNEQMRQKLNFLYAKNYAIDTDLSIVFKNIWK